MRQVAWNGSRDRGYSYQPPPAENVGVTFRAPGKLPCCHSGLAFLVTAVACREKLRFSALDLSKAVKRTWPVIHVCMGGGRSRCQTRVTVRTSKAVAAGEELVISYIGLKGGLKKRRAELQRNYGFVCGCQRCVSEE